MNLKTVFWKSKWGRINKWMSHSKLFHDVNITHTLWGRKQLKHFKEQRRPSAQRQRLECVPYCSNTKQDHFPFALQLWTEGRVCVEARGGRRSTEKEFVVLRGQTS